MRRLALIRLWDARDYTGAWRSAYALPEDADGSVRGGLLRLFDPGIVIHRVGAAMFSWPQG